MNIEVTRINEQLSENSARFISNAGADLHFRLKNIAERIAEERDTKPVILLSGPSGSGKTTTAMMIEKLLDDMGCATHTLSMDNYFRPLSDEEKELSKLGKIDLESPDRMDKELLNQQIKDISACKEVELPRYDFKDSKRESSGIKLQRKPGELVIFEGIHSLNPEVITVPDSRLTKIYVSVRTRVVCGDIILHPSRVRLLRRMIRDSLFRKRSPEETMNMFNSVEDGENKYIMPYKYRSDFDVDTFMPYEMSVYKPLLMEGLLELRDTAPELDEVIAVLERLEPLEVSQLPKDSLICEFVGSGSFSY